MKSWIDIAVILAYLAGTTLFGCSFFFRKDSGDARAFVAGGGKLPGWAIALSVFATYVSSISFLALPAKAYLTNWKIRGQALRDSEIILKQAANNRLIEDFLSFLKGPFERAMVRWS